MALRVSNAGERFLLDVFDWSDVTIALYKQNRTPQDGDTENDYTEADFDGYPGAGGTTVTVDGAAATVAGVGRLTFEDITFECDSNSTPNTIYGALLLKVNALLAATKFLPGTGGYAMDANGKSIWLTQPFVSLRSVF